MSGSVPSRRIAHYSLTRKLGEGGMGVVYAAHDEKLHRPVAVKMLSARNYDDTARQRFWREARVAARINHPNICQIHEIGEDQGELFIAMELLEGEPLDARLKRGPLAVAEAVPMALAVLAALEALHAAGIVHRDLKPSNVYLTPHGVKLLDFGLARPDADAGVTGDAALTQAGSLLGTPAYMAPERVTGDAVDARSDLFAAGAILFEMLAGRPAFGGRTTIAILHAVTAEQPPALTGPPAVAAVDRVIRRALAKRPADRPASAGDMAADLRRIRTGTENGPAVARALTRLVVMPFRVAPPDPKLDFLAFSVPDDIAMALSGVDALLVRSTAIAAKFAGDAPDLEALATHADVDRVVTGILLLAGSRVRASVQLIEVPGGALLRSFSTEASVDDLFRLQDEIVPRIVDALSVSLRGEAAPARPRDPRAYELYLRANEVGRTYDGLMRARDLYQRCLDIDDAFAPAWAHLGRCHRVVGKYIDATPDSEVQAEAALRRALEIDPRLTIAHKFYAALEADIGQAPRAIARLLREAGRHGNDAELFAGLVHACRYAGLFDASFAADAEARRLDPGIDTGVEETLLVAGEFDRLLARDRPALVTGVEDANRVIALGLAGRHDEARPVLDDMRRVAAEPLSRRWIDYLAAWLDRRPADMAIDPALLNSLKILDDPEAIFQDGWLLCEAGDYERGLKSLARAVHAGYYAATTLSSSRHFDAVRDDPAFRSLLAEAEAGRRLALETLRAERGERLLGATAGRG